MISENNTKYAKQNKQTMYTQRIFNNMQHIWDKNSNIMKYY